MQNSLKWKILVPGLTGLLVFVTVITWFWASTLSSRMLSDAERELGLAAEVVTKPLADAIWNYDDGQASTTLEILSGFNGFSFARVEADGQEFASHFAAEASEETWLSILPQLSENTYQYSDSATNIFLRKVPIEASGSVVGHVFLGFDRSFIYDELGRTQTMALFIGAVAFLSYAVMLYLTTRTITRPITQIVNGLEQMEKGEYEIEVDSARRSDEVGVLGKAILRLRDSQVEKIQHAREQKLSQELQEKTVISLGKSLTNLSRRDLSQEISTPFADQYEQLRVDFNTAVTSLRDAIKVVLDQSKTISLTTNEIASSSHELALRTEKQAAHLERVSRDISQLADGFSQVTENAKSADSQTQSVADEARECGQIAQSAVEAMNAVRGSTDKVGSITSIIEDIAFQTNLLALNAGVEAARAGEAGRGFAVVAQEVRELSQRSSNAAKEIREVIAQSQVNVGRGAKLVDETGEKLTEIVAAIVGVSDMVKAISQLSKGQSETVSNVQASIGELDTYTQHNVGIFEETSAATATLNKSSDELVGTVSQFAIEGHESDQRNALNEAEAA